VDLDELYQRAAALERDGRWAEAEILYRDLFQRELATNGSAPRAADALRHQAIACRRQGRSEEAEELAILSWTVAERCGYIKGAARAVNVLALVHYSRGDLKKAEKLYRVAQNMGLDSGDDELIGFSCQNLGIIAYISGDLREARTLYLEAIASAVRLGDALTAARGYNNLGLVCTDLKEWMEAELYFARGIEIATETRNLALSAMLQVNRAKPLIQVGEFAKASASLAAAEAVAVCIDDQATLAEIEIGRATIARLQGDRLTADAHLASVLSLTMDRGLDREYALALEGIAQLRWEQEQTAEALEQLRRAGEIFRSVGWLRDAARVEEVLAKWEVSLEAVTSAG
jgi:tetratricopeptide (TPR) repeat protein